MTNAGIYYDPETEDLVIVYADGSHDVYFGPDDDLEEEWSRCLGKAKDCYKGKLELVWKIT